MIHQGGWSTDERREIRPPYVNNSSPRSNLRSSPAIFSIETAPFLLNLGLPSSVLPTMDFTTNRYIKMQIEANAITAIVKNMENRQ